MSGAPAFLPRLGLVLTGLAWTATMGQVLRTEVLRHRESADVRALVDSARLSVTHASATYAILLGNAAVGHLTSTVSGGHQDEQLAYVINGRLSAPQDIRIDGVVLAGWDRRPQRIVLEATVGTERHRLEGTLRDDDATEGTLFELRYVPPPGGKPHDFEWVLPEAPVLAPGPLPIPEFPGESDGSSVDASPREGAVADPSTGAPMPWSVTTSHVETFVAAGRTRRVRRRDIKLGPWEAHAWTEDSGFPVRLDLPGSIAVELVEEKR